MVKIEGHFPMRLALASLVLGLSGLAYMAGNFAEAGDKCQHCYELESKCRRESKGQDDCNTIVTRCLRQCRKPN